MEKIREAAREMARELRDECDGSYVGADWNNNIVIINGEKVRISVHADWESSSHFEYGAVVGEFRVSEMGRSF